MEENNENTVFEQLENKIVSALADGMEHPIYGKLIQTSRNFIVLERRSGAKIAINKRSILRIHATSNQPHTNDGVV